MRIPYDIAKAYDLVPARVKEKEEEAVRIRDENLRRLQEETGKIWNFDDPTRHRKACIIPKPRDITTGLDSWDINALDTIYKNNEGISCKIQELVYLCGLLSAPENRIKVKSGQYTEREVNARTELDMIGERARELMALPKYTVYVKKLDSAHGTKIYKTTTNALPDVTIDMSYEIRRTIERTRKTVCRLRRDIQDEIYNRQMPVIEDSEPPSPYD